MIVYYSTQIMFVLCNKYRKILYILSIASCGPPENHLQIPGDPQKQLVYMVTSKQLTAVAFIIQINTALG